MIRKFVNDKRGGYAIMLSATMVPLLGALALAIDYTEMLRQKSMTLNALDAAGIATARRLSEGATEEEARKYALDFFAANLPGVDTSQAVFNVTLPNSDSGGGLLIVDARYTYKPYFLSGFTSLLGKEMGPLTVEAEAKIQLKNTLEVALVLDNSGSMDFKGSGSGSKRIDLLKKAAKELVTTLANEGAQMKQIDKPVQFALVPFAASVNVGSQNATASWLDVDGRSPIHHENFDWTTMPPNKRVEMANGIYYKVGSDWGAQENQKVTRLTLFDDLKRETNGSYAAFSSWAGCVETRPHPYAYGNTPPSSTTPATLFVPMFAPDETDKRDGYDRKAFGNWWPDRTSDDDNGYRQRYMPKYFQPATTSLAYAGAYQGPNAMCSTTPITPLTDVTKTAGLDTIKGAIDAMQPLGATDVPEGTAWGWRVVSSKEPFTEGRSDTERGNDKVVIVLTDGANTYYTPNSLGANDLAGNKSIYSNKGYAGKAYDGGSKSRMFMGTTVSASTYTNENYTKAMNEHMETVCAAAKSAGVIIMTVALDLSTSATAEKAAITALESCASESKTRKDASGNPKKLFWNTTGGDLSDTFKAIAEELSNLRIVA